MRGLLQPKVALVHDDLIQWGGAEKVFAEISNIFPDAPIYTALADFKNPLISKNFKRKKIITSFLQKLPFSNRLYKSLLPLYPVAFEQFDFSGFDLVISHTTRFAKSIITKPETTHICYIHTPPRFLWNFSGEEIPVLLTPILSYLRTFDKISANRVDIWVAGSENCRKRLRDIYHKDSTILYPFVDTEELSPVKSFEGDYYLIISRLNKYKKVDIAVKVFKNNGKKLIVAGNGPELENLRKTASDNIQMLGRVSDELLESLLAGCRALIITAQEDFGMTAIEAQSFGKGVICFGQGGALETVINNQTGVYFYEQTSQSLNHAVEEFEKKKLNPNDSFENAKKFSKDNFAKNLLGLVGGLN